MKKAYKILLTAAAAAAMTASAFTAHALLSRPAAEPYSGYTAVDATVGGTMGWLEIDHGDALDIRAGCTETVDESIAEERVLSLYGKSIRARYDGSVVDSHSNFGYDIYRVSSLDEYFAGHEAEYAAVGYDEGKLERLKSKETYGRILIDRADGTVRSFFLPIIVDLGDAADDEGVKNAVMDWLSSYIDVGGYNGITVNRLGSRYEIIAEKVASNGVQLENMCIAVSANGVVSGITRNPVHYAEAATAMGDAALSNARAAADAELGEMMSEGGFTLDTATVMSVTYSEYDSRPLLMFSYQISAHNADSSDAESYGDIVDIAVFAD